MAFPKTRSMRNGAPNGNRPNMLIAPRAMADPQAPTRAGRAHVLREWRERGVKALAKESA